MRPEPCTEDVKLVLMVSSGPSNSLLRWETGGKKGRLKCWNVQVKVEERGGKLAPHKTRLPDSSGQKWEGAVSLGVREDEAWRHYTKQRTWWSQTPRIQNIDGVSHQSFVCSALSSNLSDETDTCGPTPTVAACLTLGRRMTTWSSTCPGWCWLSSLGETNTTSSSPARCPAGISPQAGSHVLTWEEIGVLQRWRSDSLINVIIPFQKTIFRPEFTEFTYFLRLIKS